MRKDGEVKYYTVERHYDSRHQGREPDAWHTIGGFQIAQVPEKLRFKKRKDSHRFQLLEPFCSFGANGDVWQQTGYSGFYGPEPAHRLCALVSKYIPNEEFRVVMVEVLLRRTTLRKGHCASEAA